MKETIHLHGDVLALIFTFLPWQDVIQVRGVARLWKETALETPVEQVYVNNSSLRTADLSDISHYIPKLKSLQITDQTINDKIFKKTVARFLYLKKLSVLHAMLLRSSFSCIQHNLHQLESLNLHGNEELEWNLGSLSSFPHLKELRCINNKCCTGDVKDLLVLSRTLVVADIAGCVQVTGNLLDLACMPRLQFLFVNRTLVQGDLREVQPGHFGALQQIGLDHGVYGARNVMRVHHASEVMRARNQLIQQSNQDYPIFPFVVSLSQSSPDYHERIEQRLYSSERDPPFNIEMVMVGPRKGWRWSNYLGGYCDVHWLDPEPQPSSLEYATYKEQLENLTQQDSLFAGFLEPPTPEEYSELCLRKL